MSQFGSNATALDVVKGIDLSGKTAIVTGATSGIGTETARALALAGVELVLPSRNLEQGSAVADKLIAATGNCNIRNYEMDLSDFDSVRRFADNFMTEYPKLDLLINSAGIMACPLQRSAQGYELQFTVNHLGHFLLTACLCPSLVAASSSRVVALSSVGHRLSPVVFEDLHFERRDYHKWLAYGQSKTANALFALALNKRLQDYGGLAFSVHPGGTITGLQRHLRHDEMGGLGWVDKKRWARKKMKSAAQGAATSVWAATAPELSGYGGAYCEDCGVADVAVEEDAVRGVFAHARDERAAARLWRVSERLVDQQFP